MEKRPLLFGREITVEDAEKELAPLTPDTDIFMQYYRDTEQRAILMAKALQWIEAYRASHDDVSIYYEDENLIIYKIYHEVKGSEL